LVGDTITIADICFVAELCLFFNEKRSVGTLKTHGLVPILHTQVEAEFPRAFAHVARLRTHPAFAPDMEPYLQKFETVGQAEAD
jgi:glutathione S-transferase